MENVARRILAPYADTAIELSMLSTSSERYKTYYCVECNHPFLQRDNSKIYRLNNNDEPSTAYFDNGTVLTKCAVCSQKYVASLVMRVVPVRVDEPISHIPQSIYLKPSEHKVSRYIRCLDCGYSFCTLADRIERIVDNSLPLEYVTISKVAPVEARCRANRCRQRWVLVV